MKRIAAESIEGWLDAIAREAKVYVPTVRVGGDVSLEPRGTGERAEAYIRLTESPKRILLPQSDPIVRFEGERGQAVLDETRRVLFGIRPCDAAALAILDEFFRRGLADPHYLARRDRMRLIVSACAESEPTCFCASAGCGPVATEGFDVQLYDLGDDLLAQAGTPAGKELIEAGGELFSDAGTDAAQRVRAFREQAEAGQTRRMDLREVRRIIDNYEEPEGFWEGIADSCLLCAGCAYVCPTCTCTNLSDDVEEDGTGTRRRIWDSCVLSGFTREASGHNPRGHHWVRCAHRYQHKLGGLDLPPDRVRCVGCGRCAEACISSTGILRVIDELLAASTDDDRDEDGAKDAQQD